MSAACPCMVWKVLIAQDPKGQSANTLRILGFHIEGIVIMVGAKYSAFDTLDPLGFSLNYVLGVFLRGSGEAALVPPSYNNFSYLEYYLERQSM